MADEQNMTAAGMLEEVNKAIVAVAAGGQSYRIGSRSLTRANLTELNKLREELAAEAAAANGGNLFSNTSVAFFDGR